MFCERVLRPHLSANPPRPIVDYVYSPWLRSWYGAEHTPHTNSIPLAQTAAEETARQHPGGIDFLVVLAGIVDSKHKGAIETCAAMATYPAEVCHRAARAADCMIAISLCADIVLVSVI